MRIRLRRSAIVLWRGAGACQLGSRPPRPTPLIGLWLGQRVSLAPEELVGERAKSLGRCRVGLGQYDRRPLVDGTRHLDIARDADVRTPAYHREHVVVVDPDAAVSPVENEDDSV